MIEVLQPQIYMSLRQMKTICKLLQRVTSDQGTGKPIHLALSTCVVGTTGSDIKRPRPRPTNPLTPRVLEVLQPKAFSDLLHRDGVAEVHLVGQEEEYSAAQLLRPRGRFDDVVVQLVQTLRVVAVDDEDDGVGAFVVVPEERSLRMRSGE